MNRHLPTLLAFALAATLAGCGGSTPPAEPVPAPTAIAALDTPPPQYPIELACAGIGGQTVLDVQVGTEGTPAAIILARSSGNDQLDQLARDAVQGWKFRPATRAGQPVAQTIQVPVSFTPPPVRPDACFALDAGRAPAN